MVESMVFNLIGNDRLSQVFNRAGDSAGQLQRRIAAATRASTTSVDRFTRDANGRLRDANGRFVTTGEAARRMGNDVDSGSRRGGQGLRRLASMVQRAGTAAAGAVPSLGSAGGGLAGALKGVGAAAGVTALPALGALVPMLTGGAAAAVTAKLAFGGVSDAVKLAGEDQEKYRKELAKMGPEQRKFTKAIVAAKEEFKGFGKEVQKIVLPSFTKALKAAGPSIDIVKDGVRSMSKVFADFGDEFGKLFASNKFQKALRENFDLGAGFFGQLTKPLADFTLGLLEFGAASKPTLDAFGKGIGDLLGKGLPGFFRGLQGGIKGSAAMFDGLFASLNKVLPALGELVGSIADAAGPALKQIFVAAGDNASGTFRTLAGAMQYARPLFMEIAGAARIVSTVLHVIGGVAKRVGGVLIDSLWPSFRDARKATGPLQRLADWFDKNETAVHNFTVAASNGIIDFVSMTVSQIPNVIKGFRLMSTGILTALDGIVSGAAMAFGWIPGIGEKFKRANRDFDKFKNSFISGLHTAEDETRAFADKVVPRLQGNKLKMNIRDWTAKIRTAEKQLKTAKGEKKAKLTADIKDWKAKVSAAERQLKKAEHKKVAKLTGNIHDWNAKIREAKKNLRNAPSSKKAYFRGNIRDLQRKRAAAQREVNRLHGKTVTITARFNSIYNTVRNVRTLRAAHGGYTGGLYTPGGFRNRYGSGGLVRGAGTGTSDSVFAGPWVSHNEFVVRARSVRKYGLRFMEAVNSGRLPSPQRGGGLQQSFAHGAGAASAAAAGAVVNVVVNGALDPVAVGRQLQRILLELKRTQGVNVQLGVG